MQCKICQQNFQESHFKQRLCSDECKREARKAVVKRYENSEKGIATEMRWRKNPKKKEIDKRSRSRPEGRRKAVERAKRYLESSKYGREQKKRLDILYAKTRRKSGYKKSKYSEWWDKNKKNGCVECGGFNVLCIDHKIARVNGGTDDIENLQILCRECDGKKIKQDVCEITM
jgi:5-methylcytosine-specific restriction endonuclease McrA